MCGVSGILYKKVDSENLAPIGADLVKMLEALAHRGRDSTGVTVVGEQYPEDLILRLWVESANGYDDIFEKIERELSELGVSIRSRKTVGQFLRLTVTYQGDHRRLAEELANMEGVEVHSIGETSEVIKDVGTARTLDKKHHISELTGTHGIGHVRLATESRVDISHSHPFWAHPFADITVVHNGQLTNYHKMRRKYEDMGYQFHTGNDSEFIAVYLADKLAQNVTLKDSLGDALTDLDGTFTFLVSTKEGLGYAKDQWSAKPLVTMETEEVVAIASEEVALRSVFPEELERFEPQEDEVMTWSI